MTSRPASGPAGGALAFAPSGLPFIPSPASATGAGTPYLQAAGIAMLARPEVALDTLEDFLSGFDALHFRNYIQDAAISPAAQLCKTAGQTCYMSFGPKRTWNEDAGRYFRNIMESGHGSVLEHACFTLLLYGVSRSLTHELVRHRHFSFSQVSQRYVSGRILRFVERPEYQGDAELHQLFEQRIDRAAEEYEVLAERLLTRQKEGAALLAADARTDLRKKVQQTARSLLPNETEAPVVVTGNVRAWRHFLEMRATAHAEAEIRNTAFRCYLCLAAAEPLLFEDYEVVDLGGGAQGLDTAYRKV